MKRAFFQRRSVRSARSPRCGTPSARVRLCVSLCRPLWLAIILVLSAPPLAAADLAKALAALKIDGRVILMRHTQTVPGAGDPSGFKLGDCSTQRNLNQRGISQARQFGAALKAANIRIGKVLVSQWCRADDTARFVLDAAGLAKKFREPFWPLNNVWDDDSKVKQQSAAVRAKINEWRGPGVLLMVSHGVTISPILGRTTSQGGFFVIEPSNGKVNIIAEARL